MTLPWPNRFCWLAPTTTASCSAKTFAAAPTTAARRLPPDPHFVVFWDAEAGRARTTPSKRAAAAFEAASKGNLYGQVPLLLGHVECPGFTGPPIAEADWFELFRVTYQLQYAPV